MKFQFLNNIVIEKNELTNFARPFLLAEKLRNTENFRRTVRILKHSQKIYILAYQMSQIPARDFFFKMHKINPANIFFFLSMEDQIRNIPILTDEDAVLMVSNSGECIEIMQMQKFLPKNCEKILVTNGINSSLEKFAHLTLSVGCFEDNFLNFKEIPTAARDALLHLLDMIYQEILADHFEENIEKIKKISKISFLQ